MTCTSQLAPLERRNNPAGKHSVCVSNVMARHGRCAPGAVHYIIGRADIFAG